MKCQRGDLSFIFNGDATPSQSFVVLDNEAKVYQRIHHEVSQWGAECCEQLHVVSSAVSLPNHHCLAPKESEMETEEEVDILMSSDVYSATLSTKSITFSRSQIGWLFREDKTVSFMGQTITETAETKRLCETIKVSFICLH